MREDREWRGKRKGVGWKERERRQGGEKEGGRGRQREKRTERRGRADTIICPGPHAREGRL